MNIILFSSPIIQLSERDRSILDLNASVSELRSRLQSAETSLSDEAKVSAAKAAKMASEVEELRERKREVESALKSLQSDYDQLNHTNEDLSVNIVEKERQVREVTTQVQSMQVIKHPKETNNLSNKQTYKNWISHQRCRTRSTSARCRRSWRRPSRRSRRPSEGCR